MKKFKKGIAICLTAITMVSCISFSVSADVPEYQSMMVDKEYAAKILASEYAYNTSPNYISVKEYLNKYGVNNVIKGLNKAEVENNVKVLKTGTVEELELLNKDISLFSNEPNDVFQSMIDGEFLGMEIVGISDLPPDDIKLSFKLNKNENTDEVMSATNNNISPTGYVPYTNYDVYYNSYAPNVTNDLENMAYEPGSGSYMYKYSLWFDNCYLVESDVVFNNTKLYCGSQQNNMYTYIAAKSTQRTLDFGLMANPKAVNRNQGMYAFYSNGREEDFFVEALPKVGIVGTTTNPMTIQNETIKLRLGIGTAEQDYRAELYMESDGKCIFYMTLDESIIPTLYSGDPDNHKLTFMTAISCVEKNSNTLLNSQSYFTNVKMQNSKLYAYGGNIYPFTTMGAHTYFTFICKPSTIDFNYGNNWETVDIVYDN